MIKRAIEQSIKDNLYRKKSILLLGPRQTGKTTLIKSLHPDLYINFMLPSVRNAYERNPNLLLEEITYKFNGKYPLVALDEVQKIPIIMDIVQYLIDEKKAQFILGGSSARKINNLLPGRVIKFTLSPLTLSELSQTSFLTIDHLLTNGSLPGIISISDQATIEQELQTYVETYIEEEIRKEALVRNLGHFHRFLELSCIESGNIINFRNISQEIGNSHTTVAGFYQILKECMIIEEFLPVTQSKTRKRLTKSSKYIVFDLGIQRLGAKIGVPLNQSQKSRLFEQWIGLQLRHMSQIKGNMIQIKFWRDHNGPEVDWIVERNNEFTPIEIKWSPSPNLKDAKHLITFMDEYPCKKAYIICNTHTPYQLSPTITVLPWQQLEDVLT
jgi:predicted AAA+ superfamily ATPase